MADKCSRPKCPFKVKHRGLCHQHFTLWCEINDQHILDPAPVKAHIQKLRDAGMIYPQIGRLAGLSERTPEAIMDQKYIRSDTFRAIMGVSIPTPLHFGAPDNSWVPATGTLRRLRALSAIGYTNEMLAAEIGLTVDALPRFLMRGQECVVATTAQRAYDAFQRLQLSPPPDSYATKRARLRAERRGWAKPLAWDEHTIDDSSAEPFSGENRKDDWYEYVKDAESIGRDEKAIAEGLGISLEALRRRLWRLEVA